MATRQEKAWVAGLRKAGLRVLLSPGWDDAALAARGEYAPKYVALHDTGTLVDAKNLRNLHSLNWILYGRQDERGVKIRACHVLVGRDGTIAVTQSPWIKCWHLGSGGPWKGLGKDEGNSGAVGVEIESHGGGVDDLTKAQIDAVTRLVDVTCAALKVPLDNVLTHRDYAPGRKQDTVKSRVGWITLVSALRSPAVPSKPAPPKPAPRPTVRAKALVMGRTADDVRVYQRALRAAGARLRVPVDRLNPDGATGFYGPQTAALTRATYAAISLRTGDASWRAGDLNVPGPRLLAYIGLTAL